MLRPGRWRALARGSGPPAASTLAAARSTTALLNVQTQFAEQWQSQPAPPKLSLVFAGTLLGAVHSAEQTDAECAPKKRANTGAPKPAAKKAGPVLTDIENGASAGADLQRGEVSRVSAGRRHEAVSRALGGLQRQARFVGADGESLEPGVREMAAFDLAKEKANAEHLKQLSGQKAARQKARDEAGTSGAGTSGAAGVAAAAATEDATVVKEDASSLGKKQLRVYEAFKPSDKADHVICISTEGVAGGCQCGKQLKVYTQSLWNQVEGRHVVRSGGAS